MSSAIDRPSRTAHSCPLAREEGECNSSLTRSQPPVPSGDPEIEETALLSRFWVPLTVRPVAEKETKDSPPGPPPGEGVVRSPSPEEQTSPSLGRPSQGRLLRRLPPGLAGAWTGGAAALRPAPRRCLAGGCCVCCAGAGGGGRGLPSATSRPRHCRRRPGGGSSCTPGQDVPDCLSLLLCSGELLGEVLHRVAEQAGLGHGGIQEPCLVYLLHVGQTQPEVAFLDHHGGHRTAQRPRRKLRRPLREVRGGPKLTENSWVVTTLVQVPQCLGLVNLQQRHSV